MIIAEVSADTSAEAIGRLVGQVGALTLLLWGIFKCISIARRPTTSRKCVLSLLLLLLGWLLSAATTVLLGSNPAFRFVYLFVALLVFGLLAGSIVVAIVSLVDYGSQPGRFNQGRAQAIWALILSVVHLGVGGVLMARGYFGVRPQLNQPAAGQVLAFDDLNFRFTAPGRPWVQVDANKLNRDAKVALLRTAPEVFFAIIPEQTGEVDMTTESLAEIAAANVKSVADRSRVVERFGYRRGPLFGLRVHTEALVHGHDIFYVQWFCATNGWAYQLMVWGRLADRKAVAGAADQMIDRFEVQDIRRQPPLAGARLSDDFAAPAYGYRVRCGGPEWVSWTKLEAECPYATFGAFHRENAALVVSAVSLADLEPRPEALYRGAISLLGTFSEPDPLAAARPVREEHLAGIETTLRRAGESGREFTYRVRVLQGGGFAYLVAAWVRSDQRGRDALLDDLMARVEFSAAPRFRPVPGLMSEMEKRAHRMQLNAVGMVYFNEQQYEQAAPFFKTAVELEGVKKGLAYLSNLSQDYAAAGKYREALEELDRHIDFVNAQPALQAERALLEARLGRTELALADYARLFAGGFKEGGHVSEYAALLARANQPEQALTNVEAFLQEWDAPDLRLAQAALLKRLKNFDRAIAILQTQRQKNPYHGGIAYSLGDAFIQAGRPNEALALSRDLLQQGSTAGAWFLKGRAEFALRWFREAKDSFEHAAREAPQDSDVQSYLAAVSGVLGEGANTAIKEPIPPVPFPPELLAAVAAPPVNYGAEEGAYYTRQLTAVSFRRGQESRTTDYLSVKTLSPAGVSAFSTFQLAFNPLNEDIYINRLQVTDAAGALVSTGRVADYYVLDDRSSSMATTRKVLNIPVSGLQPGCTVELTVTRREVGRAEEFTFLAFAFSRSFRVREAMLYLSGDTGAVRYVSSPELKPQPLAGGLCWRRADPPMIRWEPMLPAVADYVPMVWLSDASARWSDLVTNYLESIRDRLELPAEPREFARQTAGQFTNAFQKISAVAAYVQSNYTYKAIEFGKRARVPQPLGDIVRNKYGDCKDHAVLAQQMLVASGVPASLALVSFNASVREDLPSLDQFDHMIVAIPAAAGEVFLDCTVKSADLSRPWTTGLAGHDALILEGEPRFVRLPEYPTNASVLHVVRAVQITNQSDTLVQETLTFEGVHACYLREMLRNQSAAARRSYVASEFVSPSGELTELAFDGLERPQSPLICRFAYSLRGQFHPLGSRLVGNLPLGFERSLLVKQPVEKRALPFESPVPLLVDSAVSVTAPAGYRPLLAAEAERRIDNRFVACRVSAAVEKNEWRSSYRLFEGAGRFPADDYSTYCRALQDAVELLKPSVVCERTAP